MFLTPLCTECLSPLFPQQNLYGHISALKANHRGRARKQKAFVVAGRLPQHKGQRVSGM